MPEGSKRCAANPQKSKFYKALHERKLLNLSRSAHIHHLSFWIWKAFTQRLLDVFEETR